MDNIDLTIEDVVNTTNLKKKGNEKQGAHPIHGSNTGQNFTINTTNDMWHCFRHNTGGDVIQWVAVKHGVISCSEADQPLQGSDWKKTLDILKNEYGQDQLNRKKITNKNKTQYCLSKTAEKAREILLNSKERRIPITKREFEEEDIREYDIGLFNDKLKKWLLDHFEEDTLINSGLFKKSKKGNLYSNLYGRIIIPYKKGGNTTYFIGESINKDQDSHKYKKLFETKYNDHIPFHRKSYGRDEDGNKIIPDKKTLVITEGIYDALSAHKAGYSVLSPVTTRFPDKHIEPMSRIAKNYDKVILAFDGDEAGQNGQNKTAKELSKLGVNFRVVTLEDGKDLDDWTTENGYDLKPLFKDAPTYKDIIADKYNSLDREERKKYFRETITELMKDRDKLTTKKFLKKLNGASAEEYLKKLSKEVSKKTVREQFPPFPYSNYELRQMNTSEIANAFTEYLHKNDLAITVIADREGFKSNTEHDSGADIYLYDFRTKKWVNNGRYILHGYVNEFCKEKHTKNLITTILTQLRGKPPIPMSEIGVGDYEVVCGNEVLNFKELDEDGYPTTRPVKRDDYIIRNIPVEFNKDAECERWDTFLAQSVNTDEAEKKLQEYAGTILFKKSQKKFQKALIILGRPRTGKSVFINTIKEVVGSNTSNISLKYFSGEYRFSTANLENSYLNYSTETSAEALESNHTIKQITDGSRVSVEKKGKQRYQLDVNCSYIFACNITPQLNIIDEALFRRFLLVEFPNRVSRQNEDRHLEDKLSTKKAKEAILKWMVEGLLRLLDKGRFTGERTAKEVKTEWMAYNDDVIEFLNKYTETKSQFRRKLSAQGLSGREIEQRFRRLDNESEEFGAFETSVDTLMNLYKHYQGIRAKEIVDKNVFGKKLKAWAQNQIKTKTKRDNTGTAVRVHQGIRLIDNAEENMREELKVEFPEIENYGEEHEYYAKKKVEDEVLTLLEDASIPLPEHFLVKTLGRKPFYFGRGEVIEAIGRLKKRGEIMDSEPDVYVLT